MPSAIHPYPKVDNALPNKVLVWRSTRIPASNTRNNHAPLRYLLIINVILHIFYSMISIMALCEQNIKFHAIEKIREFEDRTGQSLSTTEKTRVIFS